MLNLKITNFENAYELEEYFQKYNRGNNFSRNGFLLLYDFLSENYQDVIIDVIGLCCQFTEYSSIQKACEEHGYESADELYGNMMVYEGYGVYLIGE